MNLVIEAFGEVEMNRKLLRFAHNAENMKPAFDEIYEAFLEAEQDQFEGQGVGPSGRWAPLAPSTQAAKDRLGIDGRILYGETGDLFASLTSWHDPNAVYDTTPDSATFGSNVEYGKFHQSRAPRSRLPRRPPVDLTTTQKRTWMQILQRHLVSGVTHV
jgi:phage gpG-like protein